MTLLKLHTRQSSRWIILSLNGLLSLLILYIIYDQSHKTYLLLQTSPSEIRPINKSATIKTNKLPTSLSELHLFGIPKKSKGTDTRTSWMVRGIIIGSTPANSLAVIASSDADEATYKSGDKLPDGTIILKILPDQVIISHNKIMEHLFIRWNVDNQSNTLDEKEIPQTSGTPFTLMKEP